MKRVKKKKRVKKRETPISRSVRKLTRPFKLRRTAVLF